MDYESNDPKLSIALVKATFRIYLKLSFHLAELIDQLSNILDPPRRCPFAQLHGLRISPLRDPFVPGRAAHRDNPRIISVADDVAQTEEADFGYFFGFHIYISYRYVMVS